MNDESNANYNVLETIITTALQKHLPHKIVKFKKYRYTKTPWITKEILASNIVKINFTNE